MSANKRSFTGFKDFPGEINTISNHYEFPVLFITSSSGKMREWNVYVRLITEGSKQPKKTKESNWNLLLENQVAIKPEYLQDDFKLPEGLIAQVWTEGGFIGDDMKTTRSAPTYTTVKNVGKKNERNSFHQALVTARGKYLKKIQEGYSTNKETNSTEEKTLMEKMFYPMLAKNYKDMKTISYPVYIQPKLDGDRCVIFLNKDPEHTATYEDVIMYTRQKIEYPRNADNDNIRKSVLNILIHGYNSKKKESIFLDGELYKHGILLQKINSAIRGSKKDKLLHIEYHMYDMFYPHYTTEPFEERTKLLSQLYESHSNNEEKRSIKLVTTKLAQDKKEDDELYKTFLSESFEGSMIRNPHGKYAKSSTVKSSTLRSKDLLKRKEVFDDEFEVVGFTDGKHGKEVGAIIWQCQTQDKQVFNVVPNLPHKERYALYKECQKYFSSRYEHRMLSVQYRGLSHDGVPQHAKALVFRID